MLKPLIKNLVFPVFAGTGAPRLLHRGLFSQKLTIVTYHAVVRSPLTIYDWCFLDESLFRNQMLYFKKHFNVLSLSTAIEALKLGSIDRPSAVITFDDGYQNNYSVAYPILRELALPATIFLTTGLIDTNDTLWNLRLNHSIAATKKSLIAWNGCTFSLRDTTSRAEANVAIRKSLRDLPRQELMLRLREVTALLGESLEKPIEPESPFRMLSSKAIAEMVESGLIEFGAHSHTHQILSRLSATDLRNEIEISVSKVQELTGRPTRLFAYPFGSRPDYNVDSVRLLEKLCIQAAVTSLLGPNDWTTCPMELRRYGIGANDDMVDFQLKIHHIRASTLRSSRLVSVKNILLNRIGKSVSMNI